MHVNGFWALCLAISGVLTVAAQPAPQVNTRPRSPAPAKNRKANAIRVDIQLVLIPVTVTDTFGAPFLGVPREAFRLFEDGVEQEVKYFAMQDAPVSLGVVFDASRSMAGRLDQSRAAVARFFQTATEGDEFLVVEFNDRPAILYNFTSDTEEIERSLVAIQPRNWTALFDAVYFAINQMKRASNPRKALLLLSDGGDNSSRYTEPEMRAFLREADICVYSIGLVGGSLLKRHAALLRNLSDETGGLYRQVNNLSELPDAVEKISTAMRSQYLLGYLPKNRNADGLFRKVEVRVEPSPERPRLRVSWRQGYYAPDR
jgi:Ca-activated chloride channel family protein